MRILIIEDELKIADVIFSVKMICRNKKLQKFLNSIAYYNIMGYNITR